MIWDRLNHPFESYINRSLKPSCFSDRNNGGFDMAELTASNTLDPVRVELEQTYAGVCPLERWEY